MAIITYPLNNIEYTAEDAELYHATRTSGVFANDDFPITVSGDGNVVTIGEGIGWIRNSKFSGKVVANKAEMSLDLGLPHATYPRIDAVVLQFNTNANSSEIIVKNGTAKTNPTPPEVVRTESVYELHLYHVYREAGAASVTASNVTDLRSDSAYCGIMADDVTMLGDDYVRKNMVGVANGVASLGGDGKVPKAQLPPMNYIPTSQKGVANGVASLNANGKLAEEQRDGWLKVATGTYTGTGKVGPNNKNSLSFNFEPYLVIISRGGRRGPNSVGSPLYLFRTTATTDYYHYLYGDNKFCTATVVMNWGTKKVSWYATGADVAATYNSGTTDEDATADQQFNANGNPYYYVAFGV